MTGVSNTSKGAGRGDTASGRLGADRAELLIAVSCFTDELESGGTLSGKLERRAKDSLADSVPLTSPSSGKTIGASLIGSPAPRAIRAISILGTLPRLGAEPDGLRRFP